MSELLTPEDKKYLRRVCRYLASLGMTEGNVDIDYDSYMSKTNVDWNDVTHFSNNYSAEIPEGLIPILKKMLNYVLDNELIPDADEYGSLNYERLLLFVTCESKQVYVAYDFGYTKEMDENVNEFEGGDDVDYIFKKLEELFAGSDVDGEIELRYNGSGDSGYLEDYFENGFEVPEAVSNWCYDQLESLHGGWELNEGSQGTFLFDMVNEVITLSHAYNENTSEEEILFIDNF